MTEKQLVFIYSHDKSHERLASEMMKQLNTDELCARSMYDGHAAMVSSLDVLAANMPKRTDLLVVDGRIAYWTRLRSALNERGISKVPTILSYVWLEADENLQKSGSDFGLLNLPEGMNLAQLVRQFIQKEVPYTAETVRENVAYNPTLYQERNGILVPR